jgi:uncharacterized tellurite resistance protein B-like protein
MVSKEKLYDAFGELIYAVAQADGLIQDEEITALQAILKQHAWASEVQWSFNYEQKNATGLKEAYAKALDTFQQYGPTPEYVYLIEIIYAIATASAGIDVAEKQIIDNFQADLKARLIVNIEQVEKP